MIVPITGTMIKGSRKIDRYTPRTRPETWSRKSAMMKPITTQLGTTMAI